MRGKGHASSVRLILFVAFIYRRRLILLVVWCRSRVHRIYRYMSKRSVSLYILYLDVIDYVLKILLRSRYYVILNCNTENLCLCWRGFLFETMLEKLQCPYFRLLSCCFHWFFNWSLPESIYVGFVLVNKVYYACWASSYTLIAIPGFLFTQLS